MTEPPLTADPQPPLLETRHAASLVGARAAGIALLASGVLIVCVAFALMAPSGGTSSGAGGEGILIGLFAMSPWLYFVGFNPFILVMYAAVLVLLGVAVLRGNRRSLVVAVWIVTIEAVPSVLLLPMFGGMTIVSVLPRVALGAILIATLRRQPSRPATAAAVPQGQDGAAHAGSRQPGSLVAGLGFAAAAGLALAITVAAGDFLMFTSMRAPVVGPVIWWWVSMRGPCAILAFTLGWFAGSGRVAVLRGAVAAGVCVALTVFGEYHGGTSWLALAGTLIGFPVGGAFLGWLGHEGRRRGTWPLLAALSLPVMLAVDQVLFPVVWTGPDVPGPGTPILLALDAALALAFGVRFLRRRAQHTSSGES